MAGLVNGGVEAVRGSNLGKLKTDIHSYHQITVVANIIEQFQIIQACS